MKSLLALVAIGLFSIGAAACGSSNKGASSSSAFSTTTEAAINTSGVKQTPATTKTDKDQDNDVDPPDEGTGKEDSVTDFGPPATSLERSVITTLVERYYAAAATQNGSAACSMLYSTVARTVPQDYGTSPPGPSYLKGTTCHKVMTRSFRHFHNELGREWAKLKVFRVRSHGRQALVELSFGTMPEREVRVTREGQTWKMESLLGQEIG